MFTIDHCVTVTRQNITNFIVNRPILELFRDAVRIRGTSAHQYWWEQPMDFDTMRVSTVVAAADDGEDDIIS